MKNGRRGNGKTPTAKKRLAKGRVSRPREVYVALRKLLNAAQHVEARAAGLEDALRLLREQERARAIGELLLALRNSSAGDLVRSGPDSPPGGDDAAMKGIAEALVEAFGITPVQTVGARIPLSKREIPDSVELDRPMGEEPDPCVALEVVSVGWSYRCRTLLKPLVRPIWEAKPTD